MSTTKGDIPPKLYSLSVFKWVESANPIQVANQEDFEEYMFFERAKIRKHF